MTTIADKMRELTIRANKAQEKAVVDKNNGYARKMVSCKIKPRATKGHSNYTLKVGRRYSPTLVENAFNEMGFKVQRSSKNGRAFLRIGW